MNRALFRPVPLSALLMLAVATSCADERTFEKKFSVTPGGTFTLNTDFGDVAIVGTTASEVSIVAHMKGRASDLEDFEISVYQNDAGVEVKGQGKHSGWRFWDSFNIDVRFSVNLPNEYSVRLNTAGGDIKISDIEGKIQGETSGGDLYVNDIKGEIRLNTSGGDIRAERVAGGLRMQTSGGDIIIASSTGEVEVNTSGGDIRVSSVEGKVRAETSGGDVMVKVTDGNRGVHAETSGGDIDIIVGKDIAANIDASTSGGSVICDLPVTMSGKIDESRVQGTVNGGGNLIYAHTSGGDVTLRPLE
jgi:DUF4097 and DUF4098 domain-containing protein YvlB